MAGQIGRLVAQAVFMVVIARTLGVHRFGALVAIVALVSIASPFVSWGAGHILVRDVARDPQTLAGRFGSALRTIVTSGLVVIPLISLGIWVANRLGMGDLQPSMIAIVRLTVLFAGVTVAARAAQEHLGTAGLWTVGLVGGLVDVDSVAVAAAQLRQQGAVEVEVAASTYLFATLSNLLFKGATVVIAGGRALARQVLPVFLLLAAVTAVLVVLR